MVVPTTYRWVASAFVIVAVSAFASCGENSGGFEEEMKPLLFEQAQLVLEFDALLDPVFEEISTLGDLIAAAQSFSNRQEKIHEAHQDFISNLDGWKSLTPPPIAEDFYQRALEMINLRVSSLGRLAAAVDDSVITGQIDTTLLVEAGREWSAALEIWTGVLAESNSFNAGELAD